MILTASGLVNEYTGIGVIQRMLYPKLVDRDFDLHIRPRRDRGSNPINRLAGVGVALSPPRRAAGHLSICPPAPLHSRGPLGVMVHDLQWLRTRGRAAAVYRSYDLKRTVNKAKVIFVVSERTGQDLSDHLPACADKVRVVRLGPGQVDTISFGTKAQGSAVLVGRAPHKRNELAALALCSSRPLWLSEIILISVSQSVKDIFACEWPQLPVTQLVDISSAQLMDELGRAEFYIHLGLEEGFGLPFLEALNSGCQVIAIDQPVVGEVLGEASIKISDGDVSAIGAQLSALVPVPEEARLKVATTYSWDSCADQIGAELHRAFA